MVMLAEHGIRGHDMLAIHWCKVAFDGEVEHVEEPEPRRLRCLHCRGRGMRYDRERHTMYECKHCSGKGWKYA